MRKGRPDLSSLQGETSQPHVITQASQSPGQPTVPKRWVAQGCEALAPGIFLFVTLTHHVAAEFRVLPAPKGRVVLWMAMFQRLQALVGEPAPGPRGAIASQPAYFVPLGPGAGGWGGSGEGWRKQGGVLSQQRFMDGWLHVRGKGPWAVPWEPQALLTGSSRDVLD